MKTIWGQIADRVLTRVVYFNLPDADWQLTHGMHRLDFGLDLEFGDRVVSVTWRVPGQSLTIAAQSLGPDLSIAEAVDASTLQPWKDAVGRNVHDVVDGEPEVDAAPYSEPCPWSMAIEFRPDITVWLAAANYVDPDGGDSHGWLLPCGDELIVIGDPELAARLGLS